MLQLPSALVWFRRDLRIEDHAALAAALAASPCVWCVFVFDSEILDPLRGDAPAADRRVEFIRDSVSELDRALRAAGGVLLVRHGRARKILPELARALGVAAVFCNHDYEPLAIERDRAVSEALRDEGRQWFSCKDQVIFEKDEVLSGAGRFFSVFTPYKRAWLKRLTEEDVAAQPTSPRLGRLAAAPAELVLPLPSMRELGFAPSADSVARFAPGMSGAEQLLGDFLGRIDHYRERRDFPGKKGPSYLSVHLRFGTISIRALVRAALARLHEGSNPGAETWLSELIWRDFYAQILYHRPDVTRSAFKPEYDAIAWERGPRADALFLAWCRGATGYPLVDAAMHQINQTGYMHNRLRMVVASFLVKDLGIDWRWGEAYFARHLIDFDLASNNGGWQWAASSGCDAQPYFRIFNPTTQSEKFDPDGKFIRRYLPALARIPAPAIHEPALIPSEFQRLYGCMIGTDYPEPIVEHRGARERTLERYAIVKARAAPVALPDDAS